MTRVRVRESVGGRRIDADDNNRTGGTDNMTDESALAEFIAEQERKRATTDAGSFFVTDGEQIDPIGRDAWVARAAAQSRKQPGPAERVGVAKQHEDDDAGGSAFPGGAARDAWMARTAAQSRQPAGNRNYPRGPVGDGAVVTEVDR